jgi:hypothetical protein
LILQLIKISIEQGNIDFNVRFWPRSEIAEMNKQEATEILGKDVICEDGGLHDPLNYLGWNTYDNYATLDGEFTAEKLEAIAWWMKNNKEKP